jgi:hypothetical protein
VRPPTSAEMSTDASAVFRDAIYATARSDETPFIGDRTSRERDAALRHRTAKWTPSPSRLAESADVAIGGKGHGRRSGIDNPPCTVADFADPACGFTPVLQVECPIPTSTPNTHSTES